MLASGNWNSIVQPDKYVQSLIKLFLANKAQKVANIFEFRNIAYESVITGTKSVEPHESNKWFNAADRESAEWFFNFD